MSRNHKADPEPWKIVGVGAKRRVVDANGELVRTEWDWRETECHANACVMAAAPEMLEVLERVDSQRMIPQHWTTAQLVKDVIAKARGNHEPTP